MTQPKSPVSAIDQELQALGEALIQPEQLPPNFPKDFFHQHMEFPSTNGMTNGAKFREFRHRALYSALRASAYEKVLSACLARTRLARIAAFIFALVWGGCVLSLNWSKTEQIKTSLVAMVSIVPGLGGMVQGKGALTPEQADMEEMRRQLYK